MFSWPRKLLFRYPPSQSEEAPSGERLRDVKAGIGVIAGKTVWSMPERLECKVLQKWALYKYLFTYVTFGCCCIFVCSLYVVCNVGAAYIEGWIFRNVLPYGSIAIWLSCKENRKFVYKNTKCLLSGSHEDSQLFRGPSCSMPLRRGVPRKQQHPRNQRLQAWSSTCARQVPCGSTPTCGRHPD